MSASVAVGATVITSRVIHMLDEHRRGPVSRARAKRRRAATHHASLKRRGFASMASADW